MKKNIKQADRSNTKDIKKTYDFRKFNTVRVFCGNIKNNFVNVNMANDKQNHLAKYIKEFKSKASAEDSNLKKSKRRCIK